MKNSIQIYTDGSYNAKTDTGGWAAIIFINDKKETLKGISYNTTQHRMELEAVINALDYLKNNNNTNADIFIYTDSQYVADLKKRKEKLENNNFYTKKGEKLPNKELIKHFFRYMTDIPFNIEKVLSHQKASSEKGYNREVDKICRQIVRKGLNNS